MITKWLLGSLLIAVKFFTWVTKPPEKLFSCLCLSFSLRVTMQLITSCYTYVKYIQIFSIPILWNTLLTLWQLGCRGFKQGIQNWKYFCLKIDIPKLNNWILRIGLMGKCQKVTNFDFQNQFTMSKIIGIFLIFFSLENINLGAHFLLSTFFDNINF